jgi:hypothetical protein
MLTPSSGLKERHARNQHEAGSKSILQSVLKGQSRCSDKDSAFSPTGLVLAACFMLDYCLVRGLHIILKGPLTFEGLHYVIFQNTELAISTAVRTSNPTRKEDYYLLGYDAV